MLNAGVSRVDISPVAGVAHAGWGAQTHQVSLGNDMPTLVTALVVTNTDVELAIVDVDILLFHPEQHQQVVSTKGLNMSWYAYWRQYPTVSNW